jgi:Holliday junction resolvase RusA-like endonuclease
MGSRYVARVYDSDVADEWKAAVDAVLEKQKPVWQTIPPKGWEGPIWLSLRFLFPRPTSHKRRGGSLKPSAPSNHIQKPDGDNCAKLVLDRITRNGQFWKDDSQVVALDVSKWWADGEPPGVQIRVDWLG